jgi:hypothetical protein
MEDRCQSFLLLLVKLWGQEGASTFQQKQFECLLTVSLPIARTLSSDNLILLLSAKIRCHAWSLLRVQMFLGGHTGMHSVLAHSRCFRMCAMVGRQLGMGDILNPESQICWLVMLVNLTLASDFVFLSLTSSTEQESKVIDLMLLKWDDKNEITQLRKCHFVSTLQAAFSV